VADKAEMTGGGSAAGWGQLAGQALQTVSSSQQRRRRNAPSPLHSGLGVAAAGALRLRHARREWVSEWAVAVS